MKLVTLKGIRRSRCISIRREETQRNKPSVVPASDGLAPLGFLAHSEQVDEQAAHGRQVGIWDAMASNGREPSGR